MKKNRGFLLGGDDDPLDVRTPLGGDDDPFDVATHATSKNGGGSVAQFADLRSPTESSDEQSSRQSSDPSHRQSRQPSRSSSATNASAGTGTPKWDGSDAALNATHTTLNTTTTADLGDQGTPSPACRGRDNEEETPFLSNQGSFARERDEFERCYHEAEGREGGSEGPSSQQQQQAGGRGGGPAPPVEEKRGKKKKTKSEKKKKKKKTKDKTASGSKVTSKGKIKGRVGAGLRRGFLPPSRRDTAPIAAPPTPRRHADGECVSGERWRVDEVLQWPEHDAGMGREPGVELELTPGGGDYGREAAAAAFEGAGERVANDEGANDVDGEDTLGNEIDLVYDEVIRKNEPLSVGAGYDQIDISDGSVERKEEPSLQSYLTNLGGAIEELLVGSKDPNKDEGTVTEPPKQDESPVSPPVREGEGQESKPMKEDEDTVGRLLKDDVGSTGVLVEEVVVKRVEKRSSATMRVSPGRKNLTSLLTSASDDLEDAPKNRRARSTAKPKFGADVDGGEASKDGSKLRHVDSRSNREITAVTPQPNLVPEFVLGRDDASTPSLLTEPEIRQSTRASSRRKTPRGKGRARVVTPTSVDGGSGVCATVARGCRPLSPSIITGRSDDSGGDGGKGTHLGLTAASMSGYKAGTYSRAGGIERVWNALTCGEDTTVVGAAEGCGISDAACGVGGGRAVCSLADTGEVERAQERHVDFALEFQSVSVTEGLPCGIVVSEICVSYGRNGLPLLETSKPGLASVVHDVLAA